MKTSTIAKVGGSLVLAALAVGYLTLGQDGAPTTATPPADTSSIAMDEATGDLYGRVITYDGTLYEGPLRWGGGEEAFWGHTFNGVKDENPWAAYVPRGSATRPARIFGVEVPWGEREADLSRPFMARFGDIERIEARGDGVRGVIEDGVAFDPDIRVILKSGTVFDLDRLSASDFDDGVRVWDARGVVDLGPREIRAVDLFAAPRTGEAPNRLYGTVRTRRGEFSGFVQWDREESLGRDRLVGRTAGGEVGLQFGSIRSIARLSDGSARVTTFDGTEVVLSGTRKVGPGNRGVYVDDPRYGRVLASWDAFERVDFRPVSERPGRGPAYSDFPPGRSLMGTVTTHDGRHLAGRLVFDLDESETTETLDAPAHGVDYTIPFGRVASVVLPERAGEHARATATVTLQNGEHLELERAGDLGEGNAGLLVFTDGQERPEYVAWADVERVDFDRAQAPSPSVDER